MTVLIPHSGTPSCRVGLGLRREGAGRGWPGPVLPVGPRRPECLKQEAGGQGGGDQGPQVPLLTAQKVMLHLAATSRPPGTHSSHGSCEGATQPGASQLAGDSQALHFPSGAHHDSREAWGVREGRSLRTHSVARTVEARRLGMPSPVREKEGSPT